MLTSKTQLPAVSKGHPLTDVVNLGAASPAANQTAVAAASIVQAVQGTSGTYRRDLNDDIPVPTQVLYTVVSDDTAAGSAVVNAYCFNEDVLNATPTNNGSGAETVQKSYSDGFSGKLLNNLLKMYGVQGLPFKSIQITCTDNTSGSEDKAALNAANPQRLSFKGDGSSKAEILPIASTASPLYLQSGFLVLNQGFRMRANEQLQFTVTPGTTMTVVLILG